MRARLPLCYKVALSELRHFFLKVIPDLSVQTA